MSDRPSATVILNPGTGRGRSDVFEHQLRSILSLRYDVAVLRSRSAGDLRALAREAATTSDVVVAVGGDGTVSEVVAGILGSGAALGIIPTGSTNVVAKGLGLPRDPCAAARALVGPTRRACLDVGWTGSAAIVHMGGSGFDALMMRDARPSLKRVASWLAYVPPAVRHVWRGRWRYRITLDGAPVETEARMVLVANGDFVLSPRFRVGRDIRPDDGVLDVLVFNPAGVLDVARLVLALVRGRVERQPSVRHLRGRAIRVESDPPAPIEFDGDYAGTTPFEVRVHPAALAVLVPKRHPD